MKIKIGNKEYGLVYSIRTIILFETIADKGFAIKTITDWMLLAYASIMATNKNIEITFDDFVEAMDLEKLNPAIDWLQKQMKVAGQFIEPSEDGDIKKK